MALRRYGPPAPLAPLPGSPSLISRLSARPPAPPPPCRLGRGVLRLARPPRGPAPPPLLLQRPLKGSPWPLSPLLPAGPSTAGAVLGPPHLWSAARAPPNSLPPWPGRLQTG